MTPLPKTYKPKKLRVKNGKQQRKESFGIGIERQPNQFGMMGGPFAQLKEALETVGQPEQLIIWFRENGTDKVLYSWDDVKGLWQRT
jgi:hypothetical protein